MPGLKVKIKRRRRRSKKEVLARFLVRVDVPDDVVGEADDFVFCALGHLGEALCLGLVLECVAGEVDAW